MTEKYFQESLYQDTVFQGFEYSEVLVDEKTGYQHIAIYDTPSLGRVLVLDGIVQATEKDEFIYHEMLVHVPIMAIGAAKRVLIVGGGDGGSLREVLKHPVDHIDLVEIDKAVIDHCSEFMPTLNDKGGVFKDPRVNVMLRDAFDFLKFSGAKYDVIIIDSTDPVGAAEALFSAEFYALCAESLSDRGAISVQDGVAFLQPEEAAGTVACFRDLGLEAGVYTAAVPTYYGGLMNFGFGCRDPKALNVDVPTLTSRFDELRLTTKQYTPQIHAASFVLPPWISASLEGNNNG